MKQRITLYTFLLSGFLLLLSTSDTKASHIMGGDITYNCIAPNTFAFTAQFYRDCNGIPLPNTVNLTVYSPSGCGPSQTITLELVPSGPQIVTPLCPGVPDACNTGGTYGIQQYTYTHIPASQGNGLSDPPVVLNTACTDWTVWWSSCCRNGAITTGPANDGFYLETLLNNSDAPCNNSPTFLNTPTPYACVGETVNYSHGVSEWDGDSLVFSLIPCLEGNAPNPNSVNYNAPYSGTSPLSSSTGFTIDQQTGGITFTPNMAQVGVICVLVEEYRNGVKVGHVMRDMQFTVLPCSNSLPLASGANGNASSGGATGDYNIQVCEGELIDFTIETFDSLAAGQTSGDNIDLSWNGGINNPNASFTVFNNNTDSSSARFRWPTTKNDAGFYIFTVNLQDDACPINGVNIFSFSITIDDVPDVDAGGYQVACTPNDTLTLNAIPNSLDLSYQWQTVTGPGTVSNTTILTPDVPPVTGTYKLIKTYQSGCVDSNVVAVDLSPGLQLPAIADANLCQGDSVQLDATIPITANPPTTVTNNTVVPFGQAADTAMSVITVSGVQPGVFDISMLQSVCVDVNYPLTSFLSISLVSPNGTVIDLSSNNGSGANYTNTCFEVNAGTPITSGSNPFTGTFEPEGNLSNFNGNVVNGDWTLWVATSTALPGLPNLQLNSWNMTFVDITDTISYAWTPAIGLSCGTCPDPWASPTTPTTYQVVATDFYNCTDTQAVFIDIISALTAPVVTCAQVTTTSLTFAWGAISGATGYEVSTDNGATWVPANGTLQHQLTGLALGQSVTILVRGISTCPGVSPSGTQTCTTTPCTLDASFVSSTDVTCNAGADGTADVSATGGTPNYTYQIGTQPVMTTGSFTGLVAGNYVATVTDVNGCTDTVQVTINEPTAITFTTDSTSTNCNGGADGTAIVVATGGTGALTYQWDANAANQTTDTATDLTAGLYNVTITDANNCFTTGAVTVNEPPLIVLDSATIDVSCYGAYDGSAQVLVQGGTGPFTYTWSSNAYGQTSDSIVGLNGGTYSVTVTDANGCSDNISMYVDEASAIVLTTSATQATCNGFTDGSATVAATGGTPGTTGSGYTYLWDANANNQTTATATSLMTGTYFVTVTDDDGCTAVTSVIVTAPPSMTLTTTSNSPSTTCSYNTDGTAVVTPSGGNGGYTYSWDQGTNSSDSAVVGLPAGTSYVTVTDILGCSEVDSVIIAGPAPIVANPTAIAISCNGADDGSITLAPVGGTGAYSFVWSNADITQDISNLAAGTYIVTITDANNCVFTDSATIVEPDTIQTTASMTAVSCLGGNDGTVTALPVGGQIPYTYNWSNSSTDSTATILTAGTYTLTVTDAAGCTDTASVVVTEPATAVTSTISGTDLLCNGDGSGTATVVAADGTVGSGYTYLWDDPNAQTGSTATGLAAGTYNVTVTDGNGCTTTNSITLAEPTILTGTIAATPASCFGATDGTVVITPAGGTAPYSYQWSAPSNSTDSLVTGVTAGWHYVTVTDDNMCTYIDSAEVVQPLAITTTTTVDSTSCFGAATGIGSVTATGGNGGFTYSWSFGGVTTANITGLPAGWHYVTVTDVNLCSTVDSIEVLEPTLLTSSTTVVDANCFGAATGSATVIGAGGTLNYSYQWDAAAGSQTTATASNLLAGTYSVTVTDLNGCTSVTTATVGQPATPVTSTTSGTDLSCNGDGSGTVTVIGSGGTPDPAIASGYTYLWSDVNAQTTATATGLQAGTYYVTVTDLNGCNTLDSVTINEPTALIGVTSATPASCFGATDGTVVITPAGGTPGYMYQWSVSAGSSGDSSVTGLAAGMHYVTITDANSCTYVDSFEVLEPAMIMTSTSVTPVGCFGDSTGTGGVTVTGGNGNETFIWSFGGTTTQNITGLPAGWHYVTVTDINGCSTIDSIEVLEPTPIALTTTQVDVGCFGQATGSATVTAAGGTPGYTYLWNTIPQQVSATATNLPAGTYTVTVTDANSCFDTISVTINQPLTGVTITDVSFTQVSCFGGSDATATVTATGGAGNYNYTWNPSGQTTQTATGLTIGTYTVTVTDMNGCFTIDSVTIDEPAPISTIFTNVMGSSCNGGNDGTATVAASGGVPNGVNGYTYVWSTVPQQTGVTATGLNGGQTYTVVVTDANGCTTNNSVTIPQPDPITLSTTQVNVSCFSFTDAQATVIPAGGTPGFTFQWDANAGNQTNGTATGLAAGSYSVVVTDAMGCTAVTGVTIIQPAELVTNKTTVDVLCKGESTGEAEVLMSGGTGPYYINWDNGLTDPPTDLAAGTYSYVVTDANGCQLTDSVTINEPSEGVTANYESIDVTCYEDRDGIINIYPEGGVSPYQFSLNGTTFDNNNSKVGLQGGNYTYYVRDDNGCIYTETVTIGEPDEFTVDLGPDVDIILGESVQLEVVTTNGSPNYTYLWTPAENLSCTDCGNPTVDSLQDDRYITVLVEDLNGCTAEDDIYIRIEKPRLVFIANAFTPNDDGNNDWLFVQGGNGTQRVVSFQVFDRWGEIVYETADAPLNDSNYGWDGTYKGQAMNGGVFVWVAEVEFEDGERLVYKGSTVLIR